MAAYTNVSGGVLILPDMTEIKPGDKADLGKSATDNPGVAEWIAEGRLKAEPAKQASKQTQKRDDD